MSQPLNINKDASGEGRISGRINVDNAAAALSRGTDLFAQGQRAQADISALQSADSITLAVLLAWAVRARKSGGELTFSGASPRLRAIAHLGDAELLLGFAADNIDHAQQPQLP